METNNFINLFIMVLIFFFSIISFMRGKSTSRKIRKNELEKKIRESNDQIKVISNIYTIFITTQSGSSVYSIINSLYKDNPAISEIVKGLSIDMDSFIQYIHSDFLEKLGVQVDNQKQVDVSIIQLEKFHLMILGTRTFRIIVFLREKPSQSAKELFKELTLALETQLSLEKLTNKNIIKFKVENILRKFIRITLLSAFIIDPIRLQLIEKDIKTGKGPIISQEAILALKQLALLRSGQIKDIQSSPNEQGKEFDQLLNNRELSVIGKIHYNVAYALLEQTLHLPEEIISEALANGSSEEILILIPVN